MAGRPRKYLGKVGYSQRVFYFPNVDDYKIVWEEFITMCLKEKNPVFYHKDPKLNKGSIIRRIIMSYVYNHTSNVAVKEICRKLMLDEDNQRIALWERDNKTKFIRKDGIKSINTNSSD